jgi:pimeloyl-ACP methyl ester carboxylesterase
MNGQPGAARRCPSCAGRVMGMLVVLVTMVAGLPSGPAVADAQSPAEWAKSCSSAQLRLGGDHVELAPPLAGDTNPDGSRVAISADRRGKFVPVIMVHGWTSKDTHGVERDGAFSHIIDLTANRLGQVNTTRSLIGQLQRDRGAAVFTFDYRDYAASWVDDPHLGPALGKVIDCLYKASDEKVIIVGHSMGGLIARYAARQRGLTGQDRRGEISTVITFGTPETGSVAALLSNAAANSAAATSSPLAVLHLILAACGRLSSSQIITGTLCDSLPASVRTFDSDAGRALRAGSAQLAALRPFPAGISVDALAGGATFDLPGAGWFALPWESTRVDVGDLIVTSGSATKGASSTRKVSCAYQLNGFRGVGDQIGLVFGLVSKTDVAQQPLAVFSGPCFHTQLMRGIELTNEATGAVTDDISSRTPRFSPVDSTRFLTETYGYRALNFDSPTHNIHCGIFAFNEKDPKYWKFGCAIDAKTYVEPPNNGECSEYIHYGGGFYASFAGSIHVLCRGGAMFDGEYKAVGVIPYGSSITYKDVTCESMLSGMSCRNTTSGAGFTISSDNYSIY